MKVPPKRKGNESRAVWVFIPRALNESPSEKEGKCDDIHRISDDFTALNESPSEKEGKSKVRIQRYVPGSIPQ